jgi:formylglycine-generating enzyme required for sulfatase activity
LLPAESASLIKTSGWYKNEYDSERIIFVDEEPTQGSFNLNGIAFNYIPSGKIITGNIPEQQLSVAVKNFMISENPVTRSVFEKFLGENPQWADSFTDYFEDEISVFQSETYDRDIITGISWFVANAFCQWLSKQLPASMAYMEVRLPAEFEWEYAAGSGMVNMERIGWEWCADFFAPLRFTSSQAVESPERVLRGKPSSSEAQTRASLPPELSSPLVTFRPVIIDKDR